MPVAKLLSSSSMAPVHSTSKPSTVPSPSSSMPLLHWQAWLPQSSVPVSVMVTLGGSGIGSAAAPAPASASLDTPIGGAAAALERAGLKRGGGVSCARFNVPPLGGPSISTGSLLHAAATTSHSPDNNSERT